MQCGNVVCFIIPVGIYVLSLTVDSFDLETSFLVCRHITVVGKLLESSQSMLGRDSEGVRVRGCSELRNLV